MKHKIQFMVGLVLALTGAGLMIEGSILRENTVGMATVIGIIGILLIATSRFRLLK